MCGRFALYTPPARLARYFGASLGEGAEREQPELERGADRRGARRPGPPHATGGRRNAPCSTFRWGLIPWWSKDTKSASRLFNARSETVAHQGLRSARPSRSAASSSRPTASTSGASTKSGGKQPHFFTRADGAPMALAGLAERWRDQNLPPDAPVIRSCTIITTSAGRRHGRHPRPHARAARPGDLRPVARPGQRGHRGAARPAARRCPPARSPTIGSGPRIGNVRNNDPELIAPAP